MDKITFVYMISSLLFLAINGLLSPSRNINLADINGNNGLVIHGEQTSDFSGYSVSSAGDVNGDGIDDIIIGAFEPDQNTKYNTGRSYVVFGSDQGFSNPLGLENLNGSNGFVINGAEHNDSSGMSVASAGDFNNDGVGDLLIGAPDASTGIGSVYIIWGNREEQFPSPFELSDINGVNGLVIHGEEVQGKLGFYVSSASDVNGDGINDMIISSPKSDGNGTVDSGAIYVIFGNELGLPNPFRVGSINGVNGFKINGVPTTGAQSGFSVSKAGDINADGISDLLIGVPFDSSNGNLLSGKVYIIFGKNNVYPNLFELSSINGLNGIQINGENQDDHLGYSVSLAGDVNGDSIDDIILGAPFAQANNSVQAGAAYVIFGSNKRLPNPFNISTINGLNGFKITGNIIGGKLSHSVSGGSDINGDGLTDIIIGEPDSRAGRSHVIFGSNEDFSNPYSVDSINDSTGYTINGVNGGDLLGFSVSGAGDFNDDGIGDIILGAHGADPNDIFEAGNSYVIFGKEQPVFANGFD